MNDYHLARLIRNQATKYGSRTALRYRDYELETWKDISWNEFAETIDQTAYAMATYGIRENENIGVFSQNKPECLYTDFAAFTNRATAIPLYATSSESQVQYIVNDASIRVLFVGEQYQYDTALRAMPHCHTLEKLIIFDNKVNLNPQDKTSIFFTDFIKQNYTEEIRRQVESRRANATEEDLANILYTSGTTGEPKGVMLHHSCYIEQFHTHEKKLKTMSDKDVVMNFLPLTHVFEKTWTFFCLYMGCTVCINLKPAEIQNTIKEIRPSLMCAVPRFWEKVYAGVQEKINQSTGIQRKMMQDAIRIGKIHNIDYLRTGQIPPLGIRLKYAFYEKTIYKLLKKTIGLENGNFFPTAGAAIPHDVEEFVHSVGIDMIAGYGLTESTATVSCFWKDHYELGSVGTPMPGLEVKIGENNEILLRGKSITKGYYRKEAITRETIDAEGWFHTGDAGYIKNGMLYLTERIKDLFKTSNGKYIAPQAIETKLVVDRYIDQIAIIADQRKFVSALIVPVYSLLEDYAESHHITYANREELMKHPSIIAMMKERIDTLQQQFAHYEQVKRFTLVPQPFSMERGELTNTLKIKRPALNKNYAEVIDLMYQE